MKLWQLDTKPWEDSKGKNPWEGRIDTADSFIVRAKDEQRARQLAHDMGLDESRRLNVWLDPDITTCTELTVDGQEEVVARETTTFG